MDGFLKFSFPVILAEFPDKSATRIFERKIIYRFLCKNSQRHDRVHFFEFKIYLSENNFNENHITMLT